LVASKGGSNPLIAEHLEHALPMSTESNHKAEDNDKRDYYVELAAAILLGVATVLGAYAAYQGSLWSGNCLTAYNQGTNTLGDANRELLRGVQEHSFDAVLWMENIKAKEAETQKEEAEAKAVETAEVLAAVVAVQTGAEEGAAEEGAAEEGAAEEGEDGEEAEDDGEAEPAPAPKLAAAGAAAAATAASEPVADDEDEDEDEDPAQAIIDDLLYDKDMPVAKQLQKLLNTRKNLGGAMRWADAHYAKRMAALTDKQKLELANRILAIEAEQAAAEAERTALLEKLGVEDVDDEDEVAAALEDDDATAEKVQELEARWFATQDRIDAEYDRLSKPMFFESPDYIKTQERAYTKLLDEGNKQLKDGQLYNGYGDKFTLTTVLFTVTLFFAGMSTVLRRLPIKVSFLVISTGMLIYSTFQMFTVPFA
jgi:hypothetical protein